MTSDSTREKVARAIFSARHQKVTGQVSERDVYMGWQGVAGEAEAAISAHLAALHEDGMVEQVARELHRIDCDKADADERREGRQPPEKWADPWSPTGGGIRQRKAYLRDARRIIAALAQHTKGEGDV